MVAARNSSTIILLLFSNVVVHCSYIFVWKASFVNMEVLLSGIILKCRRLWWRNIKTFGAIPQDSVSEPDFGHHWTEYKTHLEVFSALGFG